MDSISSSSLNFYGVGTNEFLGIVLSGNSQKDQLSGLAGWGYRYRVAIMGYHPDDTTLKDEEITYAICALGTCDGSGAGGRLRTPKISPGDVVLGKFLDGEKRQIPMITNVLGRTSGVKYGSGRFEVKSGFSEEIKPGGLGQQEYSQQDNVVSGTLKKQQPPKGDAGKNDEERKKETAALIEKQTGVEPEAAVGVSEARQQALNRDNPSEPLGSSGNRVKDSTSLDQVISSSKNGVSTINTDIAPTQAQKDAAFQKGLVFVPYSPNSTRGKNAPEGGRFVPSGLGDY